MSGTRESRLWFGNSRICHAVKAVGAWVPLAAWAIFASTVASAAPISSGLTLWFDGADVNGTGTSPANGASVSTWVNKAPSGQRGQASATLSHVIDATHFAPTIASGADGLNNLPVVKFANGIDNNTVNNDFVTPTLTTALSQPITMFTVWQVNGSNPGTGGSGLGAVVVNGLSNSMFLNPQVSSGTTGFVGVYSGGADDLRAQPVSLLPWCESTISWHNNAVPVATTLRLTPAGGTTTSISGATGNNTLDGLWIGGESNLTYIMNGYVAEVLVYNRQLDPTTEIPVVEDYLNQKWFVSAPLPEPGSFASFRRRLALVTSSASPVCRMIASQGGTVEEITTLIERH